MTVMLDLTPEAAQRVTDAKRQGLDVDALFSRLAVEKLPATTEEPAEKPVELAHEETSKAEPFAATSLSPERERRKREILARFAKYRGVGGSVDEFLKQKHEELAQEEPGL